MIYQAKAENTEEIANLLRYRGRIVVVAPPRSGKTTELIRYAEERYPNGRFAVVAKEEKHSYIIKLHWIIYNNISHFDVVTKRLLGERLVGEDVVSPQLLTPEAATYRVFNYSTPVFCDEWNSLPHEVQRAIIKRRLFIASTTS